MLEVNKFRYLFLLRPSQQQSKQAKIDRSQMQYEKVMTKSAKLSVPDHARDRYKKRLGVNPPQEVRRITAD